MHRHLSLEELPRKVAELGYEWIELSPRDDFLTWWVHPRLPRTHQELQEGAQGPRREDRVATADVSLGESARRRAPDGGALLEARDRDRGRDGRRHDEQRVRPRPLARS